LWEFTLVEGLDGGGAAIVMKLHHSLTDGIGGIELAGHVVDLQPEPSRQGPLPAVPAGTSPGPLGLIREALQLNAAKTAELARNRLVRLPSDISGAVRDPRGAVDNALETARSIYRFVAPVTTTLSPVMTEPPMRRLVETLGLTPAQVFGILRVAVTGQTISPPLFESMEIVGKEVVLQRVRGAIEILEKMK
jgi:hypothetical protein